MAIIPNDQQFHTMDASVNTENKGSALSNAGRQAFTMQDIADSVSSAEGAVQLSGNGLLDGTPKNILDNAGNDSQITISDDGTLVAAGSISVEGINIGLGGGSVSTNIAIGLSALEFNAAGDHNIAIGEGTLEFIGGGDDNVAIGYNSQLFSDESIQNISIGTDTLLFNDTGGGNVAIGNSAMSSNDAGGSNIAIGKDSLRSNISGNGNNALGRDTLSNNTTGEDNTALGAESLVTTHAGGNQTTFSNTTGVGANSKVSGSDQVQLGDLSTSTYAWGAVQDRSDERDKAEIKPTELGLNFINKINPVQFKWDYREKYNDIRTVEREEVKSKSKPNPKYDPKKPISDKNPEMFTKSFSRMVKSTEVVKAPKDGSRAGSRFHQGVIAQQVKSVMDEMGVDFAGFQDHKMNGGEDVLSIGYTEFIAPLISAVQELSRDNNSLKDAIMKFHDGPKDPKGEPIGPKGGPMSFEDVLRDHLRKSDTRFEELEERMNKLSK